MDRKKQNSIIDGMMEKRKSLQRKLQNRINARNNEMDRMQLENAKDAEEAERLGLVIKALAEERQKISGEVVDDDAHLLENSVVVDPDDVSDTNLDAMTQQEKGGPEKTISEVIRAEAINILDENREKEYTCKQLIELLPSKDELEKRSANLSHLVYQAMRRHGRVKQTETKPLRFYIPKKELDQS